MENPYCSCELTRVRRAEHVFGAHVPTKAAYDSGLPLDKLPVNKELSSHWISALLE